jgi:hypothetical protein
MFVMLNPSPVILSPSLCHSERSEESPFVAQCRLREESPCSLRINSMKNLIVSIS